MRGDQLRIQQVLTNILSNACKFTPSGGAVELSIGTFTSPDDGRQELHFIVQDTGIGIPREKQENIFQAFAQADGSITRRFGGTGLGLSICKRLIDLMDGDITLESVEGRGTTFTISIPYLLEEAPAERAFAQSNDQIGRKFKILITDDNDINRRAMRRRLTRLGHTVTDTRDPIEALHRLKSQQFDVILLDIQMPYMSGPELTRAIRNGDGPNKEVPIIAVTAHAFTEDVARCRAAGMNAHLPKPLDYQLLTKTIESVLRAENSSNQTSGDLPENEETRV